MAPVAQLELGDLHLEVQDHATGRLPENPEAQDDPGTFHRVQEPQERDHHRRRKPRQAECPAQRVLPLAPQVQWALRRHQRAVHRIQEVRLTHLLPVAGSIQRKITYNIKSFF